MVDFLRTTYSSRFYYSRNPDQYIVGRYHYASEAAEFLQQPSLYGSAVWLDPWEVQNGLGDSLEDYERVEGLPLSTDVLSTAKTVLPLRRDCPGPRATEMSMSSEVYKGLPTKCWRVVDPAPPSPRYRVTFTDVLDTSIPGLPVQSFTLDLDPYVPFIWSWYGTAVNYDSTLTSLQNGSPLPEGSKVFYRWYYFVEVYTSNFYISIPEFWWDGITIDNPTLVPLNFTTSVTCGQMKLERL